MYNESCDGFDNEWCTVIDNLDRKIIIIDGDKNKIAIVVENNTNNTCDQKEDKNNESFLMIPSINEKKTNICSK